MRMKKGVSPLIEALMLVVMGVGLSAIVIGWLPALSTERTASVKNLTNEQLRCEFSNIFIKSATYNCSSNCAAGTTHTVTLSVKNSGRISLFVNRIYIQNTTGTVFAFGMNDTTIDASSTVTLSNATTGTCTGINNTIDKITVNSVNCPSRGANSIPGSEVTFANC